MRWIRALASADLPLNGIRRVLVEGQAVLLVRLETGRIAASDVLCPHEGADLSEGTLYMGAINCPWHHYLYDLETGENRYPRNVFPPDLARKIAPLRLYGVREAEGAIWIRFHE